MMEDAGYWKKRAVMAESLLQTQDHIANVRGNIYACIVSLMQRAELHDYSKLQSPEAEGFAEIGSKLADLTYGSPEYQESLKALGPILQQHYSCNSHHPNHFSNGIAGMTLLDVLEMFCDWKAACMRHKDGNILESIEINQKRFGYDDMLKSVFQNTVSEIGDIMSVYGPDDSDAVRPSDTQYL